MAFNGTEGEEITLATASNWTENYRNKMGTGDPKGHFFGKNHFTKILNQSGCEGIRIYNAINDVGEKVLILVGAKANEDDMDGGTIVEKAVLCPPRCGKANDLNS